MATQQDIRRRIRSVGNTSKITRAMELVSAAKLRRAQLRIEAMRPYADRMLELMARTAQASSSLRGIPLLERREARTVAIVPVTGDRGLAGAFNAQIIRRSFALERELEADGAKVRWLVAGSKGVSTLRFRRRELSETWTGFSQAPSFLDAQRIAHELAERYSTEDVDRVLLVYNHYDSPLVQHVVAQEALPIPEQALEREGEKTEPERRLPPDFIYEPEPEQILARLLPSYLETMVYRGLLESAASEHGARMTAMRNASKNAGELLDTLTVAMNRARQADITQEILEVVAGADAL
ncbi:MAG: ATP synthase F1 subunit gamma [Gaiellaceae bacterium]